MDTSSSSIPAPRDLLTSLLKTLFTDPVNTTSHSHLSTLNSTIPPPYLATTNSAPPSNPLKSIPASQRALLATLHVLFPPPMLLQALDLLDRGLVTKVSLCTENSIDVERRGDGGDGGISEREVERSYDGPAQGGSHQKSPGSPIPLEYIPITFQYTSRNNGPGTSTSTDRSSLLKKTKKKKKKKSITIFQVRSSQPLKSRFRDHLNSASTTYTSATGAAAGGNIYTVHLEAWNCSCAAFAFAAFPASAAAPWSAEALFEGDTESDGDGVGSRDRYGGRGDGRESGEKGSGRPLVGMDGKGVTDDDGDGAEEEERWEFGGLSFDGRWGRDTYRDVGGAPVCKHLLACLLGDKWKVLKVYVKDKDVRRDEMAGLEGF